MSKKAKEPGRGKRGAKPKGRGKNCKDKGVKSNRSQKAKDKDWSWKGYTLNQQEVAKRIKTGDYEMITGTGWGFLDRFFIFL